MLQVDDFIPPAQLPAIRTRTSTYDCTGDIQDALNAASSARERLIFGGGRYRCLGNLVVPVGFYVAVDIEGQGWTQSEIEFYGTGAPQGLYFQGSATLHTYDYCGSLENIRILAQAEATRCITYFNLNHPRLSRVDARGADGCVVEFSYCLAGHLDHCTIGSGGSASRGQVEIDSSTTFSFFNTRIFTGDAGVYCGLRVNGLNGLTWTGGTIESSGIAIVACDKAEANVADGATFMGINLENPTATYLKLGEGWTGASGGGVKNWRLSFQGSPSGSPSIPKGVTLYNCANIRFDSETKFGGPEMTASYSLEGTGNKAIYIEANRNMYGTAYPYVKVNGTHRPDAGPHANWNSEESVAFSMNKSHTNAGASLDCATFAAQGGMTKTHLITNASAQTITTMTPSQNNIEVVLIAQDGNSTIAHSGAGHGFRTLSGSNLAMQSGRAYKFISMAGGWHQM